MEIRNPRLKALFDALSHYSALVGGHRLLSCNEVLGKNILFYDLGERYLNGGWPCPVTVWGVVRKIGLYMANSFRFLARYAVIARKWRQHGEPLVPDGKVIFIHTDIVMAKVAGGGEFKDPYFDRLKGRLEELDAPYCWLPSFCDLADTDVYGPGFRALRESGVPVLAEWQMLSVRDWLRMALFVLAYPWAVLWFAWRLDDSMPLSGTIRTMLLQTLDHPAVSNYARRLYGRNVARLGGERLEVVSWFEGRVSDLNLYQGLREQGNAHITGAAMYVWPSELIYMHHDENQAAFGRMPDTVLVNGPAYVQSARNTVYEAGPSLRSTQLLDMPVRETSGEYILVVLPYFHRAAAELLEFLPVLEELGLPVVIKGHPYAYEALPDEGGLPKGARYSKDSLYDLLSSAAITVGTMTGCLVESVCVGVPSVSFRPSRGLRLEYLPEDGRGDIWLEAVDGPSLIEAVRRLLAATVKTRKRYADVYRRNLFTPVTDQSVDAAFGLPVTVGAGPEQIREERS